MSRIVEALERLCENTLTSNLKIPAEIEQFMIKYPDVDYKTIKVAADKFFADLEDIKHKENDWEYIDTIYDEKRAFYLRYIDFARKCHEKTSMAGITGYGRNDVVKLKIMDLCRAIDYNFPYGWK